MERARGPPRGGIGRPHWPQQVSAAHWPAMLSVMHVSPHVSSQGREALPQSGRGAFRVRRLMGVPLAAASAPSTTHVEGEPDRPRQEARNRHSPKQAQHVRDAQVRARVGTEFYPRKNVRGPIGCTLGFAGNASLSVPRGQSWWMSADTASGGAAKSQEVRVTSQVVLFCHPSRAPRPSRLRPAPQDSSPERTFCLGTTRKPPRRVALCHAGCADRRQNRWQTRVFLYRRAVPTMHCHEERRNLRSVRHDGGDSLGPKARRLVRGQTSVFERDAGGGQIDTLDAALRPPSDASRRPST